MKITISTKAIKSKDADVPNKGYLCFRLREKAIDIKVRSDIEVLTDYWDNDTLSYKRTKKVSSVEQKKIKALVQSILTALNEQYDSATADVAWMKSVIDDCMNPKIEQKETLTTVVSRMKQYIAEHPMSPKSAAVYKPTIKKLQRYEAYKREIEGKEGFTLYCETIRPEDYLDFREYVINEHVHYSDYPEFYLTIEELTRFSMQTSVANPNWRFIVTCSSSSLWWDAELATCSLLRKTMWLVICCNTYHTRQCTSGRKQ